MSNKFMMKAIQLSIKSVSSGTGPFGAVIVKNNKIISEGFNTVTLVNDPTSHAEIAAIRIACKDLNNFSLEGCDLYTTCEPCPMCLSAIYWARIDKVYYANTRSDAHKIDEIGTFATKFFDQISGLNDLITALKSGNYQPVDVRKNTDLLRNGPDIHD